MRLLHFGAEAIATSSPTPSMLLTPSPAEEVLVSPGPNLVLVLLTILDLLVGLAVLWTGLAKVELSRLSKSGLSALGLVSLVGALALQGWLGLWLFVGAAVLGILGHSAYLTVKQDSILTYAAIQAGVSREEMKELHDRIASHKALAIMRPIRSAELVCLLSQRARSIDEIEEMAIPIAMLWSVHKPDLAHLVEKFDQILRLYGEPAGNSMSIADTLTAATRHAAATFEQMLDATVDVMDPPE
jgi:hypothetical protein